MRPKKVILCVDSSEIALNTRKFLLETRGYRVAVALDVDAAMEIFASHQVDVVVSEVILRGGRGAELVALLKATRPDIPVIQCGRGTKGWRETIADVFLPGECHSVELLEALRVCTQRKRGPKKRPEGVQLLPQAVTA